MHYTCRSHTLRGVLIFSFIMVWGMDHGAIMSVDHLFLYDGVHHLVFNTHTATNTPLRSFFSSSERSLSSFPCPFPFVLRLLGAIWAGIRGLCFSDKAREKQELCRIISISRVTAYWMGGYAGMLTRCMR